MELAFNLLLILISLSLPILFAGCVTIRLRHHLPPKIIRRGFWFGSALPIYHLILIAGWQFSGESIFALVNNLFHLQISSISPQMVIKCLLFFVTSILPLIGSLIWILIRAKTPVTKPYRLLIPLIGVMVIGITLALMLQRGITPESLSSWIQPAIIGGAILTVINASIEESNKLSVSLIQSRDDSHYLSQICVILFVAIGFAFYENIFYALIEMHKTGSLSQTSHLLFSRTIFSLMIHVAASLLASGIIWRWKESISKPMKISILGISLSILLHSGINISLNTGSSLIISIVIWLILVTLVSFFFYRITQILDLIGQEQRERYC